MHPTWPKAGHSGEQDFEIIMELHYILPGLTNAYKNISKNFKTVSLKNTLKDCISTYMLL